MDCTVYNDIHELVLNQSIFYFYSVEEIKEILVLGFYPANEMTSFIQSMEAEHGVSIRYLQVRKLTNSKLMLRTPPFYYKEE